jgi:hypothetical protein
MSPVSIFRFSDFYRISFAEVLLSNYILLDSTRVQLAAVSLGVRVTDAYTHVPNRKSYSRVTF